MAQLLVARLCGMVWYDVVVFVVVVVVVVVVVIAVRAHFKPPQRVVDERTKWPSCEPSAPVPRPDERERGIALETISSETPVLRAAYSHAARQVAAALGEVAAGPAQNARVAQKWSVVCVDLAKALMDHAVANTPDWDASQPPLGSLAAGRQGYLENLLPDGLHMSGEAYKVLWGLLEPEIEPRFPNEDTEGYVWPVWRDAPWLESVLEKNSTK